MTRAAASPVAATVKAVLGKGDAPTENIGDIVERIRPAVEPLARPDGAEDALLARCIEANVRRSVEHLRGGSTLLEERIQRGQLAVLGSVHSLESGAVSLLAEGA
jgi:carbonic anhydrase